MFTRVYSISQKTFLYRYLSIRHYQNIFQNNQFQHHYKINNTFYLSITLKELFFIT